MKTSQDVYQSVSIFYQHVLKKRAYQTSLFRFTDKCTTYLQASKPKSLNEKQKGTTKP